MGLMFILPKDEKEIDRVEILDGEITLKSYGLPLIFWGYLGAGLTVLFAMILAVKGPLVKLYHIDDPINKILVLAVIITIAAIILFLFCFFFYEKFLSKKGNQIKLIHRIFFIPIIKKTYELKDEKSLYVKHYLDSPNVAKMRGDAAYKGFENRGYFQLCMETKNNVEVLLDRSSQKRDLIRIKELLEKY